MRTGEKAFNRELFFAALADRTRLRLINLMDDAEVCVCFFVAVIDTNQPKISRHLAYLKRANLVSVRRAGRWAHYELTTPPDEQAALVFAAVRKWLRGDQEMQRDVKEMAKLCHSPAQQQPAVIQAATRSKRIKAQISA